MSCLEHYEDNFERLEYHIIHDHHHSQQKNVNTNLDMTFIENSLYVYIYKLF